LSASSGRAPTGWEPGPAVVRGHGATAGRVKHSRKRSFVKVGRIPGRGRYPKPDVRPIVATGPSRCGGRGGEKGGIYSKRTAHNKKTRLNNLRRKRGGGQINFLGRRVSPWGTHGLAQKRAGSKPENRLCGRFLFIFGGTGLGGGEISFQVESTGGGDPPWPTQ